MGEDNRELVGIMGSNGMIIVKGKTAPVGFLYKKDGEYSMEIIPGAQMTVDELVKMVQADETEDVADEESENDGETE